jgi:Flp pilus assembly protein TadG
LRGDDGAALVEFALIAPFLFLVLFGIIEFGLTLNDYQSIRQGVREGARDAVVADFGTTGTCGINGPALTATGNGADNARKVICTTKARASINDLRVRVVYTAPTTAQAEAGDYGKVTVCAAKPAESITGLLAPFLGSVDLDSRIEMRAEKDLRTTGTNPPNALMTTGETDPTGRNWSWC